MLGVRYRAHLFPGMATRKLTGVVMQIAGILQNGRGNFSSVSSPPKRRPNLDRETVQRARLSGHVMIGRIDTFALMASGHSVILKNQLWVFLQL